MKSAYDSLSDCGLLLSERRLHLFLVDLCAFFRFLKALRTDLVVLFFGIFFLSVYISESYFQLFLCGTYVEKWLRWKVTVFADTESNLKKLFVIVINLTTYTFIATAHGGTVFSTAFSFVCWLYNNNMVAGCSRCSAI